MSAHFLTESERALLSAVAEVATPASARVSPDAAQIDGAEVMVHGIGSIGERGYRALLHAFDLGARAATGKSIRALDADARAKWLGSLTGIDALRWPLFMLTTPLKYAAMHNAAMFSSLGLPFGLVPSREKRPRWEERISRLADLPHDEHMEVDVVVIGSGAGGAPMARALAQAGHAVLVLENGEHHTRRDFDGLALPSVARMYQQKGALFAFGNAPMQVLAGKTVGGSTTINSGTCFRAPDAVLREWSADIGTNIVDELGPYFESVERTLEVGPNPMAVLGGNARVVARGAEALGWTHAPLPRNAPGCDGQGLCCFGCPTDAKRSTNVTYVPKALEAGAMLFAGAEVERVLTTRGRASGVVASARRENGSRVELRVSARAVVVAGGAIPTPLLLLRSGLANSSGMVGKNLSLHPASYQTARFAERIDGSRGVPQGYGVHQFHREGLLMEGVFVPPDMAAAVHEAIGPAWSTFVDKFEHQASFGFMVRDTARGRVRIGPNGYPLIRYDVSEHDRLLMLKAHARLGELFLAAGAEVVMPGLARAPQWTSIDDVRRFEREAPKKYAARDIVMSSFHPLGTARMGVDPRRSVVGPSHETHDVPGLFVADGSVFPGPPGVNPQVTIMAMAERAAVFVGRHVEGKVSVKPHLQPVTTDHTTQVVEFDLRPARRAWTFSEIMAGQVRELEDAVTRDVVLNLDVAFRELAPQLGGFFAHIGARLRLHAELSGTATIGGLAKTRPCQGHLMWAPLGGRDALVYELTTTTDDGTALFIHGKKHVFLPNALRGATELYTDIKKVETGAIVARGMLRFDLRTMPSFVQSFALPRTAPEGANRRVGGSAVDDEVAQRHPVERRRE